MNNYQLCAFADEASPKLAEQIVAMRENNIEYLEMRGVDGVNVAKLTAERIGRGESPKPLLQKGRG